MCCTFITIFVFSTGNLSEKGDILNSEEADGEASATYLSIDGLTDKCFMMRAVDEMACTSLFCPNSKLHNPQ